jgi:hypothetical protein
VIKEMAKKDTATFLDSPDTDLPGLISTEGTSFWPTFSKVWRSKSRDTSWLRPCIRR